MLPGKVIAFYTMIYLNLVEEATRAVGVLLIAAVGMIHLAEAPYHLKTAPIWGFCS